MERLPKSTEGRVFRDPIHGLIDFTGSNKLIGNVLETHAMQRLRRVKQMGLAWFVYAGAEHSRFGHALGAFHIADKITKKLKLNHPLAQLIKVAALVHDIGHGPFSHTWEEAFPKISHEQWGFLICKNDSELQEAFYAIAPELSKDLLSLWNQDFQPAYASKLVSSQLDVDRLDYLLRDGHYSGVGYATFDLEWILHALRLETIQNKKTDLVLDYSRGMHAVEQYLFARSYMYAQVYHHKTVRSAETLFLSILRRFKMLSIRGDAPRELETVQKLANELDITTTEFLGLDDLNVLMALKNWAGMNGTKHKSKDKLLNDLSSRFMERKLFKTAEIAVSSRNLNIVLEKTRRFAMDTFGENADYYYKIDTTHEHGYKMQQHDELLVVGHPKYKTVSLGQLLEDLPLSRLSQKTRLIYAPELQDRIWTMLSDMGNKK